MSENLTRIVIAGGGTGGHVQPAIAVIHALKELANVDLHWIGSSTGIEQEVASSREIPFSAIPTGKLRRYFSFHTVADAIRIPLGIGRSRLLLRRVRPHVVYSTGGFVSVPTVIAAWLAGIPVLTHEQTATIGLANRINARFANTIALAFAETGQQLSGYVSKVIVTGNPVRPELLDGDPTAARMRFGLPSDLPLIYITGGSLGAQAINECVRDLIPTLVAHACVIHQCGPESANGDLPSLRNARNALPESMRARYAVHERIGAELADVYSAADLVIGRAGAGTVAELALLGKPSILIPLPGAASDEQTRNAETLARRGGAVLLPQSELTPDRLWREISNVLHDRDALDRMSTGAKQAAQPDAARLLAAAILALTGSRD